MSDVNVLLGAVDSAMNTLTFFNSERADVTARVSFALSSLTARVALETEQCRRALEDAEAYSCSYININTNTNSNLNTDDETASAPAEDPEIPRLRAKLESLENLNARCILTSSALSARWLHESKTAEAHTTEALRRMGLYLRKLNRITLGETPESAPVILNTDNKTDAPVFVCIVDSALYPETAEHIRTAQTVGFPSVLTLDRTGAAERRKASLAPVKASRIWDRDEYPCACFKEGGAGAHVMYVAGRDNRGAGSYMGWQMRNLPDGAKVRVRVI